MLPVTAPPARRPAAPGAALSPGLWLYLRRLTKPRHMDWRYHLWTIAQLLVSPKTVYRHTSYHKQTKGGWARDDPAFVVISSACVALIALVWGLIFSESLGATLSSVAHAVVGYYLGVGAAVATAAWWAANRLLARSAPHPHAAAAPGAELAVEWAYCFDVHTNAVVPLVALLGIVQLLLCPVLALDSRFAAALSCLLYLAAVGAYLYVAFLGFAALPALERPESFLYPIVPLGLAVPVAVLAGFNPTRTVLRIYFGYT